MSVVERCALQERLKEAAKNPSKAMCDEHLTVLWEGMKRDREAVATLLLSLQVSKKL